MSARIQSAIAADGLADIIERVLDKGVVIAGDIAINLVGVELLTIKLRLVLCSVDKARELGIGWWQHDPFLTGRPVATPLAAPSAQPAPGLLAAPTAETEMLRAKIAALEAELSRQPSTQPIQGSRSGPPASGDHA